MSAAGRVLHRAREAGHTGRLRGLDSAGAMLEHARKRTDIEWILGDLGSVDRDRQFDVIVMTGHAFQVFVDDNELRASLAAIRSALTEDGHLVFETRSPRARAWEHWTPDNAVEATDGSGAVVRMGHAVDTPIHGDVVSFTHHMLESPSGISRRRAAARCGFSMPIPLSSFLSDAQLAMDEQFGDWTRQPLVATASR